MGEQKGRGRRGVVGLAGALAAALAVALGGWLAPAPARAAGVVGAGTAASCTGAALAAAVAGGGTVTFSCGAAPVTIVVPATLDITAPSTTIDGGGTVTLSGGGQRRIIRHRSLSSATTLTLRGLKLAGGYAAGPGEGANGAAVESIFQGASPSFKPALVLDGVTFADNVSTNGGGGDYGGGAVYSRGGSVTVTGSRFTGNRADGGGGGAIHILQSGLAITGSTFTGNSAVGGEATGGAIYIDGLGGASGVFSVADSAFEGNTAYNSGGAIYVNMYEDTTRATVARTSFARNAVVGGAGALGGAISGGGTNNGAGTGNPRVEIVDSTFEANSARRSAAPYDGSGGALAFAQRAVISITSSTFAGNRAEGSSYNANGGALYVVNNTDQFTLLGSTFADNYAGWVGGAVTSAQIGGGPGGVVRDTIFANNSAGNGGNSWAIAQHCSSELADGGNNLQYPPRNNNPNTFNEVTCLQGKSAIGQRGLPDFRDPKLAALQATGGPTKTMPIAADSPARDAGSPATCTATDQRGVARAGTCDIGAHEFSDTPFLASVSPPFAQVGRGSLAVTLRGADFDAGSVVTLQVGAAPATVVTPSSVAADSIAATVPASAFASLGTLTLRVRGPNARESGPATIQVISQVSTVALPLVAR